MAPPRHIAIVGATATGKTAVAEELARRLDGEVVCADSRQIFAELEIGTGKPDPAQRAGTPHHLFDAISLADPDHARASAGAYAKRAHEICAGIRERGRSIILVGGSGLYVRAALSGLAPTPAVDAAVRSRLRTELEQLGVEALHRRLAATDPASAARLSPRDAQRITRALEVHESTGHTLSWWHARPASAAVPGRWTLVELIAAPSNLRQRIEARTRWMFENGLAEEASGLIELGLGPALERLHAIGYDEAVALSAGVCSLVEAEARTTARTVQLAKRQRTWFRHQIDAVRLETSQADVTSLVDVIEALPDATV